MVSLTFDDGLTDTYEHALPLLKKYRIPSTQYIITDPIAHPSGNYYMSADQIKEFEKAGSEIGSHTVDHKDLATLSADQVHQELVDSQAYLTKLLGHPASDFASPYGSFTQATIEQLATTYCSHRSTYAGFNAPDMINPLRLKVQDIDKETSPEQVIAWIDFAKAQKVWIILVFHEVNPDGRHYSYPPASLEQVLQHVKSTQTKSVTVSKGLQVIKSAQVK
jgi:peptidoglycan/xylan/chitin deacetylase (PgdA/CDA1 family)